MDLMRRNTHRKLGKMKHRDIFLKKKRTKKKKKKKKKDKITEKEQNEVEISHLPDRVRSHGHKDAY